MYSKKLLVIGILGIICFISISGCITEKEPTTPPEKQEIDFDSLDWCNERLTKTQREIIVDEHPIEGGVESHEYRDLTFRYNFLQPGFKTSHCFGRWNSGMT